MPKGPAGQKRPADVIGCAIKVAKIATGEITEDVSGKDYTRRGGLKGGKARAKKVYLLNRGVILPEKVQLQDGKPQEKIIKTKG